MQLLKLGTQEQNITGSEIYQQLKRTLVNGKQMRRTIKNEAQKDKSIKITGEEQTAMIQLEDLTCFIVKIKEKCEICE